MRPARALNSRDNHKGRGSDSQGIGSNAQRQRRDRSRSRSRSRRGRGRDKDRDDTSSHRNDRGGHSSGYHKHRSDYHSGNTSLLLTRDSAGTSKRSAYPRDSDSQERGSKKRSRDTVKEKVVTTTHSKSSKRTKRTGSRSSKSRAEGDRHKKSNESDGMPFLLPAYVAKIAGSVLTPYHHALQNRIYVGNIPTHVTDDQLRMEFTRFGGVANVAMAWDEERRRSYGWCFIDFEEPKGAADVLKTAPGVVHIGGKAVRISPPNNPLGATRPPRAMTTEEAYLLTVARIIEPSRTHSHVMSPQLPAGGPQPTTGMHTGGVQYYGASYA